MLSRTILRCGALALLLALAPAAAAQPAPGPRATQIVYAAGTPADTLRYDPAEPVRVIVRFTEPPLAEVPEGALRGEREAARARILAQHDRLAAEYAARGEGTLAVRRSYVGVLNGVAVTVPRAALSEIRALDYVARVDSDRPVQTLARAGATVQPPAAGASGAWSGEGIVVAVIDTGVDYLHPALGGGIGPGFKVIGGYDFVDDDADPMDPNGHGTHVAGIVAGHATGFSGVAPGARVAAYRVLDASGMGHNSDVIAGIERAIDPNGDGAFDDRAHVLNLSLGGDGDADDPVSVAVDNAAAVGSVVVVAAGNAGGYLTVGAPASARRGIAVGAHDSAFAIAPFSSRGPAGGTFALKPDVVAPGVAVRSAWPGGGYEHLSGTSMAAPYVAGVAARLLHQHPGWDPDAVRSALMATASGIGEDVFTQGAGRVRADLAPGVTAVAAGSVSFGLVDGDVPVWSRSEPVVLRNLSDAPRTFAISVAGSLPAGVSATLMPSTLTVPPGGSATATLTVVVDNAVVPYAPLTPPRLAGEVVAQAEGSTIRIPFAALKLAHARVTWEEEPNQVWFVGQDLAHTEGFWFPPNGGILVVPPGTYTVAALYPRFTGGELVPVVHVKEGVTVGGGTPVAFAGADLTAQVLFRGRTHTGSLAPVYMTDYVLAVPGHGGGAAFSGNVFGSRLLTSPITSVTLDAASFALSASRADYVSVHRRVGALSGNIVLEPDPAVYRKVDLEYGVPPGVQTLLRMPGMQFDMVGTDMTAFLTVFEGEERFRLTAPFRQTRYLSPLPEGSLYRGFTEMVVDHAEHPWGGGMDDALHVAPLLAASASGLTVHRGALRSSPAYTTTDPDHRIAMGQGAPMWHGRMVRSWEGGLAMDSRHADAFFLDGSYARPGGTMSYALASGDSPAASGEVSNLFLGPSLEVTAPARARLRHSGHRVLELGGSAEVVLSFDAHPGDPNPPRLTDLQVRADGVPAVAIGAGASGSVYVGIRDESAVGAVSVEVQRIGSGAWVPVAALAGPGPHDVPLPDALADGYYGLRVTAADAPAGAAANRMDYRADVAFAVRPRPLAQNAPPTLPVPQAPAADTVVDPATVGVVAFSWIPSEDADPGDLISYALRLHGPGLDSTLAVWGVGELAVDLAGQLQPQGIYHWTVTASDGFAVVASEPVRLLTPGAVSAEPESATPAALALHAAYPNPSRGATTVGLSLPEGGWATLAVYDLLGRRVETLLAEEVPAGVREVRWDASALASGTYVYRLEATGTVVSRRFAVVR